MPIYDKKSNYFAYPYNTLQIHMKYVDFTEDPCIMQSIVIININLCNYVGDSCEVKNPFQNDM